MIQKCPKDVWWWVHPSIIQSILFLICTSFHSFSLAGQRQEGQPVRHDVQANGEYLSLSGRLPIPGGTKF